MFSKSTLSIALFSVLLLAAPAHAQWLYRPAMPGAWSAETSGDQPGGDGFYAEDEVFVPHPEDPYFGRSIRRHRGAGNGYNFGYGDSVRRYHGLNYSSPYSRGGYCGPRSYHGLHGRHRSYDRRHFRRELGFRSRHGLGDLRHHRR